MKLLYEISKKTNEINKRKYSDARNLYHRLIERKGNKIVLNSF